MLKLKYDAVLSKYAFKLKLRRYIEAAARGNLDAMTLCLRLGAIVDFTTPKGCTALMEAAAFGQLEACQWLIKQGAHVDRENTAGDTAGAYTRPHLSST